MILQGCADTQKPDTITNKRGEIATMLKLHLDRPLAVFDIEATGISPRSDRIVELSVVKIDPSGSRETITWRINPGIPIPPETTEIHGISDEDVVDSPSFKDVANEIYEHFDGCDLCGYNVSRFDIPMLTEEFQRADIDFRTVDCRVIDPQRVYHQREPRNLTAALSYYCGEMHIDAHGAESDVLATIRVLEGQYEKYSDLPTDIDGLDAYCNPRDPSWVDRTGKLKWVEGLVCINFGKKKGTKLRDIVDGDPGFAKWILRSDFPRDTREIVEEAMAGEWPEKPAEQG